jgi:hypothetical protein
VKSRQAIGCRWADYSSQLRDETDATRRDREGVEVWVVHVTGRVCVSRVHSMYRNERKARGRVGPEAGVGDRIIADEERSDHLLG